MSSEACGADSSYAQCGGTGGFFGGGGGFGGHVAEHNRYFAGMPGHMVSGLLQHEERTNNSRSGHGYRTGAEITRAVLDFYIFYDFSESDGSLWTDFSIFQDVGGSNRAWDLARAVNRYPVGRTFAVLYGGSVVAGTGAGVALSAAGSGGSATLGLGAVQPGEFAVIGELPATANFVGMTNVNVLSIANWSRATQAAWIQRMIAMRMPFFVAGGATVNRLTGAPTQFKIELRQILAAGYRQVGPWLFPR